MTIALSISAITEDMYADSALSAILSDKSPSQALPLLTHDRSEALRRMITVAAGIIALRIGGLLSAVNIPDDPEDDIISFECDESCCGTPESLRVHFETAVTFATLHLLSLSSGRTQKAEAYESCVRQASDGIAGVLAGRSEAPLLRPSFY